MLKLLKNACVYAPMPLGRKDILIADRRIARIADEIRDESGLAQSFDLAGSMVAPGYIDLHAHITGGGGEQGPASRVPEAQLSHFMESGVTTVVGLLGTDGVTRSLENLVAKARALNEEGMTAFALTGSYALPTVTVTGNAERDIVLIPPFIGAKIAVSDHRGSNPTGEELIRLATAVRRAGLLSGTAGLLTMHMGSGSAGLDPVLYALDHSDVPAKNLLPTHMGRTEALTKQGIELVRRGGYMDFTAGEDAEETAATLTGCLEAGAGFGHITLSSDAFGSQPRFNERGDCVGLTYATPRTLHAVVKALVRRGVALEEALRLLTATPAHLLGLDGVKGCVAQGADADLLVLGEDLSLQGVIAKGQLARWRGETLLRGRFEA